MDSAPGSDIYLSYNGQDRPLVSLLVTALTDRGLTVRWDVDLGPDEDAAARLEDWAAEADRVVVVWSPSSAGSKTVLGEARAARSADKLVSTTIGGLEIVPRRFRSLPTVDLTGWDGDPSHPQFDQLLKLLPPGQPGMESASSTTPRAPSSAAERPAPRSPSSAPTRPPLRSPRMPIRPEAQELLALALAIAKARQASEPAEFDVVLACLDRTGRATPSSLTRSASAALISAIPDPAGARVDAALAAVGVARPTTVVGIAGSADDPRLDRLTSAGETLAARLGATELCPHHVVAAALVTGSLPDRVMSALGVDGLQLQQALRRAIAEHWPAEAADVWDDLLGVVTPSDGIPSAIADRVFTVDSLGSQGMQGLALLVDQSTAVTLGSVAGEAPFVLLESVVTAETTQADVVGAPERVVALGILKPLSLSFDVLQILTRESEDEDSVQKGNPVDLVGYRPGAGLVTVPGTVESAGLSELIIQATVPADLVLLGAPVLSQGRLVGMVDALSGETVSAVTTVELRRVVARHGATPVEGPPAAEPDESPARIESPEPAETPATSPEPQSPADDTGQPGETPEVPSAADLLTEAARQLLTAATYVHGSDGSIEALDVLLAGLATAAADRAAVEASALWSIIPTAPPRADRLQTAILAAGSTATVPGMDDIIRLEPGLDPGAPQLTQVIADAHAVVSRLGGRPAVDVRHLLTVALGNPEGLAPETQSALGIDQNALRLALREAVRPVAADAGEAQDVWDQLLAVEEPTLAGRFDSDLVRWDAGKLTDQLAIDTYVNMLALLVAAVDTPLPLSIGLFGPWGSGKTYFMGLMRQAIQQLADQAQQDRDAGRVPVSCARIVPITFNAWHYADANLWASLTVRIFDELSGREKRERDELDERRQELIERLRVYQDLQSELSAARDRAQAREEAVQKRLTEVTTRQREAQQKLSGLRTRDVLAAAWADPRVQQLFATTQTELMGLDGHQGAVVAADLDRLSEVATDLEQQAKQAVTVRAALRDRGLVRVLAIMVPVLLVLGVVLVVTPGVVRAVGGATLLAALAVAGRVITWMQARAVDIHRVLGQVKLTIATAEAARSRAAERNQAEIDQAETALAQATKERVSLEDTATDAAAEVTAVQRQLDDLRAGARLQRFIAERSASADYHQQLGVVSMARRDFEDLTTALRDAITDYRAGTGEPPVVDRIVLYIDDLDRCPATRVVEVLEAVHLLLAMDLFVVVVGVDPRWLVGSLRRRFKGIFRTESARDGSMRQWTPHNYLEKIFQIPFVLPSMSAAGYRSLVASVSPPRDNEAHSPADNQSRPERISAAGSPVLTSAHGPSATDRPPGTAPTTAGDPTVLRSEPGSASAAMSMSAAPPTSAAPPIPPSPAAGGAAHPSPSAPQITPRMLDLTAGEIALLSEMAPLVRTPRVAKRMLNIYRMLRVTRDLGPASTFLAGDYQAVVQLLSLLTGQPELFGRLLSGDGSPGHPGLLARPPGDSWSAFVDSLSPPSTHTLGASNAVAASITPAQLTEWRAVARTLVAIRPMVTLKDTLEPYQRWAPRIARFSFDLSPLAPVLSGATDKDRS